VTRAIPAANRALDEAYARNPGEPGARPPRTEPWVTAADAAAERRGDGWRVRWGRRARSGFEYDVEIEVPREGTPRATRASATFSPD
jgi:hypothetical protein